MEKQGSADFEAWLDGLQLETLPRWLFKNHVDYFLLWFLKNGPGAFNAAKRSLEKHTGHRKCTMMGYTESRHGRRFYRASSPSDRRAPNALWWRPFDVASTSGRFSPSGGLFQKLPAVRTKTPFKLTDRGLGRAFDVSCRVSAFLDSLTSDLIL